MQIKTLKQITIFLQNILQTSQIDSQYRNLLNLCEQVKNDESDNLKDSICEAKNLLVATLEEFNPRDWDNSYFYFLKKTKWNDILGEKAIENINNIFICENEDFEKKYNAIIKIMLKLNDLEDYLEKINEILEPILNTEIIDNKEDIIENQHILKITYEKTIFIENLEQLEKFCRIWNQILSSFSLLTHESEEDVKILDIEASSITFSVGLNTAKALSKAVFESLIKYQKILEIKQLKLNLERLQLTKEDEIKILLAEEEITTIDQLTYTVINDLLVEFDWSDSYETENIYKQIQTSLKQTINFIERGGFIDSVHFNDFKKVNENVIKIIKSIQETIIY